MRIVIFGAPGSGKGTQAALLSRRLNVPAISTGGMLRTAASQGSSLGLKARTVMEAGGLVPDDVVVGMLRERIAAPDARDGFILDGFPRTVDQARALEGLLEGNGKGLSAVVNLSVPEPILLERLDGRSSQEGRSDDSHATILERLRVYHEQTEPLIGFYRSRGLLTDVDGVGDVPEIAERVERALAGRAKGVA